MFDKQYMVEYNYPACINKRAHPQDAMQGYSLPKIQSVDNAQNEKGASQINKLACSAANKSQGQHGQIKVVLCGTMWRSPSVSMKLIARESEVARQKHSLMVVHILHNPACSAANASQAVSLRISGMPMPSKPTKRVWSKVGEDGDEGSMFVTCGQNFASEGFGLLKESTLGMACSGGGAQN